MADENLLQQDDLAFPASLSDLLLYGVNNEGTPTDGKFAASLLASFLGGDYTREFVSLSGTSAGSIQTKLIEKLNTRTAVTVGAAHIYELSYAIGYVYVREAYLHLAGAGTFGGSQTQLPTGQFALNVLRVDQIQQDTEGDPNDLAPATSISSSINTGGQTYITAVRRIFRRTINGDVRTYAYLGTQAQIGAGETAVVNADFEDITADGTVPEGSVPEADAVAFDGFLSGYFFRQNDPTVDGALRGISLMMEKLLTAFGITYRFDNINPAYYSTNASLYAGQNNQVADRLYFVDEDDKIQRYLGTTNGDATDYEEQVLQATGDNSNTVYSIDTSGTVISFDEARTYGNIVLIEGAISYDFTDAKFMAPIYLIHRASSIALPQGSQIVQGSYKPNEINYIQLVYMSNSKVLVYFNNIDGATVNELTWTETGAAFNSVTNTEHQLRGTTTTFQDNYAITTQTFVKGEGISFKLKPQLSSTTARVFVAFVDAVNSEFSQNAISGFTIRAGEVRVWTNPGTSFVLALTDITAKFTVSIDQNGFCRFTSDVDGDVITAQAVPDGSFVQIWYADEDGVFNPSYPSDSANDFDVCDIEKVNV